MKPLDALRALGTGGEAPAEAKQRVYGALLGSLESAAAAAAVAAALPKASATLPATAAPAVAGAVSSKMLLAAAGIWLMGGATGAALYGALGHEQVSVVYVDRPVAASSLSPAVSAEKQSAPKAASQTPRICPRPTLHSAGPPYR